MSKRPIFAILAVAAVLALAIGTRIATWTDSGHGGVGGPFTLVDQDGRTVTEKDFRGRLMLIYFGYTFCPDVCPTSLGVAAAALDRLSPEQRAQVTPVFITIDPARDTPAVMKEYVSAFAPDLVGLTGSEDQVKAAEKAFGVYAARGAGEGNAYTMDHSSILYLMGKDGAFLTHFSHGAQAEAVAEGIAKHLK